MTRSVAPFGTWHSPVTPERLVDNVVRLGQLQVSDTSIYWVEGRPAEGGRETIVRFDPGSEPVELLPEGLSARTRAHEYGGRCYAIRGDLVVFSNWLDQRLWVLDGEGSRRPLTEEPPAPGAYRYADPVISPDGSWVICVRERHHSREVVNDLVCFSLDPTVRSSPQVLAEGHDFFSSPRVSPDGQRIAWLTWELPDMPWDGTRLWAARLDAGLSVTDLRQVAGEAGESVTQPRWSPAGVLHYVSDRTGWWNLYDETGDPLCPLDAEFGRPDWVFGNSTYQVVEENRIVAVWESEGTHRLGLVQDGQVTETPAPYTAYAAIALLGSSVAAIAASPTEGAAVVRIDPNGGIEVLRRSQEPYLEPDSISLPQAVSFPTGQAETAHAFYYPPANA